MGMATFVFMPESLRCEHFLLLYPLICPWTFFGGFHVVAVVKGAAVHVWVPVSVGCLVHCALTLKSGTARSYGGCGFTFLEKAKITED